MPHTLTLPIVAGLALAGSGMGIWLGNSATSLINPAYYNEPETRFHADLAANRSPDWAQVQAAEEAAVAEGLGTGCIKCEPYPEEYYPVADTYYRETIYSEPDGSEDGWAASAEQIEDEPAQARTDPEWERVQVYSAYRVSPDERPPAEPPTAEAEPAPAEAETDGI